MKEKLSIIKAGGKVLDSPEKRASFEEAVSSINGKKILVHGGGNLASQMAQKLGMNPIMHEGRRITDAAMLDVVVMVYGGLVNKTLVAGLQSKGLDAIGLTGADLGLIRSEKRPSQPIDFGFVGDIVEINTQKIANFLKNNTLPVFAALTYDKEGQLLNTNADTIASELAIALSKLYEVEIVFLFDQPGVWTSEEKEGLFESLNKQEFESEKAKGTFYEGMLPKLDNAFKAIEQGVNSVWLGNDASLKLKGEKKLAGTLLTKD